MNTITLVSIIIATLASFAACLTAGRNFIKGWREKLIQDQHQLDDIQELKIRMDAIEAELHRRGRRP